MDVPILLTDGFVDFKLASNSNSRLEYCFDKSTDIGTSSTALLRYCIEFKELSILNIVAGDCVRSLTKRTLELFLKNFDIDSISFRDIYEERTCDIIKNSKDHHFNLSNLSGFENSPFLRELKEVGFNSVKCDYQFYGENFVLDSLIGYRF